MTVFNLIAVLPSDTLITVSTPHEGFWDFGSRADADQNLPEEIGHRRVVYAEPYEDAMWIGAGEAE